MTSNISKTELVDALAKIGLHLDEQTLDDLLARATKKSMKPMPLLAELAQLEKQTRETRNLARRTKMACLGSPKSLDLFDWQHPRSIDRQLYEALYDSGDYILKSQNILLRGQAGVGKTTLAQHLGLRALQQGYCVRFSTLPATLADLLLQESIPATERRLKRYTEPDLLILDELGYLPVDARAADLLFHIISRRHEKRPVIITTNLPYKQWPSTFREASCLSALIDRFAQHCHTIDIDADSWRNKQARENS